MNVKLIIYVGGSVAVEVYDNTTYTSVDAIHRRMRALGAAAKWMAIEKAKHSVAPATKEKKK